MHMTPRYSTHSEVINICPIALTERGREVQREEEKGGGGTRAKDKEISPLGLVYGSTSDIFQLYFKQNP